MKHVILNCLFLDNVSYSKNKNNFSDTLFTDIWMLDVNNLLKKSDFFYTYLSKNETDKVKKFYHEDDRKKYIISKAILKIVLSKYTGLDKEDIVIENNENGKPFISNLNHCITYFNLSHSGNSLLLAVSSYPVGADVELINKDFEYHDIVKRCFSEEEKKYLEQSPKAIDDFYLLWTRKEAIVKATSQGIDDRLCFINCLHGINKISKNHVNSAHNWNIISYCSGMFMFSIAYAKDLLINFYNHLPVEVFSQYD